MTVTQRKKTSVPEEIQAISEPGLQITCDGCGCDLTHSIRIKCADPICEENDTVDICPKCFCAGMEFKQHRKTHCYRVVERHSYPIFAEDWGADEELLLIEGISLQGLGNWQAVAEHVGTRTKEEVEEHYNNVYINSPFWPLPRMDLHFDVDPAEFHERKRRRIASMNTAAPGPKPAPTSAPGVHEIATFLPGRLEFEHELDNEAEDLVKDLEFGICLEYDGDKIGIDENDVDVIARVKLAQDKQRIKMGMPPLDARDMSVDSVDVSMTMGIGGGSGMANGHDAVNGHAKEVKRERDKAMKSEPGPQSAGAEANQEVEEPVLPPPFETRQSIDFKLTLMEMYLQRVDKRDEAKAIMFDRGLLEYKKMQALDKKRPKEEKETIHRLRPLAKLQTAEDYENFVDGLLYESLLRRRIQELQHYRRMGLRTAQDIEKFELDAVKRTQAKASLAQGERLQLRVGSARASSGPDPRRMSTVDSEVGGSNSGSLIRKQPAPLNLANSPSLHLLTPAEQTLCSSLRIMPKPYLAIKETLVREYARRGGKLRRREARDLIKIDVNKTSRVWDYLHEAGLLKASLDENGAVVGTTEQSAHPNAPNNVNSNYTTPTSLSRANNFPTPTSLSQIPAPSFPQSQLPQPQLQRSPFVAPANFARQPS